MFLASLTYVDYDIARGQTLAESLYKCKYKYKYVHMYRCDTSKAFSLLYAPSSISVIVCSSLSSITLRRVVNTSLVTLILLSFLFLTLCFISFTPDIARFISSSSSTILSVASPSLRVSSWILSDDAVWSCLLCLVVVHSLHTSTPHCSQNKSNFICGWSKQYSERGVAILSSNSSSGLTVVNFCEQLITSCNCWSLKCSIDTKSLEKLTDGTSR